VINSFSQPASALKGCCPKEATSSSLNLGKNLACYAPKRKGRPGRFNGQPPLIVRVDRNGSAGSAQAPLRRLDEPSRDQQAG